MIEGSTQIANLSFRVGDGDLSIYVPGGEGNSEIITEKTIEKLKFLLKLAELNLTDPSERVEYTDTYRAARMYRDKVSSHLSPIKERWSEGALNEALRETEERRQERETLGEFIRTNIEHPGHGLP